MKVLDVFSGTGSSTQPFKDRGHEVFTIDFNEKLMPDLCANVIDIDADIIRELFGEPDVIWMSPDCSTKSVAACYRHWIKTDEGEYVATSERAVAAIDIDQHALDILRDLNPEYWFIENPRGLMRKMLYMQPHELGCVRHTVSYCQYGDTRMKPTDIWTNCLGWLPRIICKNGAPCHKSAPRGSKCGTQWMPCAKTRSVVPYQLGLEICEAVEGMLDGTKTSIC